MSTIVCDHEDCMSFRMFYGVLCCKIFAQKWLCSAILCLLLFSNRKQFRVRIKLCCCSRNVMLYYNTKIRIGFSSCKPRFSRQLRQLNECHGQPAERRGNRWVVCCVYGIEMTGVGSTKGGYSVESLWGAWGILLWTIRWRLIVAFTDNCKPRSFANG